MTFQKYAPKLRSWQERLALADWHIGVSDVPCDDNETRSSVDIDPILHRALVRFHPTTPRDQIERQIVHELLHVRLSDLENVFNRVVGDDSTATAWWHHGEERMIEALVDALLPKNPRREWMGGPVWTFER